MKYNIQTKLVSKHGVGNCYATAISCLLDLEIDEVPNIEVFWKDRMGKLDTLEKSIEVAFNNEETKRDKYWYLCSDPLEILKGFLLCMGYRLQIYQTGNKEKHNELIEKGTPYLVYGISPRDIPHVVIYQSGKLLHDTHPDGSGLSKIDYYGELVKLV